tara:strand:+ start:317 stop:526 length:210 start_codon:yes stop_codon:yes gene_type:complete
MSGEKQRALRQAFVSGFTLAAVIIGVPLFMRYLLDREVGAISWLAIAGIYLCLTAVLTALYYVLNIRGR